MTLTKARFLEIAKQKVSLVKGVPHFGDVWIKSAGEVKRSRRMSSLFDNSGQRIPRATELRRIHQIIDQVCVDEEGTPMFTDADIPDLEDLDGSKLDGIALAISAFNGDVEKKDADELSESSENLQAMAG